MKGLYVYGALLMGMCFAVGALFDSVGLIAVSVVAVALAGLSEAGQEVARNQTEPSEGMETFVSIVAVASWIATGCAAVFALGVLA